MGTIAKSSITLTSISDAYSVSLTPSTCVIHADYDGSNPILDNAYTLISVYCGEEKVPITIDARNIVVSAGITCNLSKVDDFTYKLKVDRLVNTLMQGTVDIKVNANNYTTLSARFLFSVERESTMLDWIQDWEKNKTTIGNSYVITPKIFVGKNIPDGGDVGLTGVYIGPAGVTGDSTGVFGYKNSIEIFRLDENGGKIGGWTINRDGLYSENGRMKILSSGVVKAINAVGNTIWEVKEDGDATFAMGNVHFFANGNADFKGKITSAEGSIGGWTINKQELFNGVVGLDAVRHQIGIVNMNRTSFLPLEFSYKQLAMVGGGVVMYYNSNTDYGMYGGNASGCTFQLGTTNMIAGWNFDQNALWMGTKNNNVQQYTSADGYITLGTAGLRGCSWYIDKDGTASFVKGLVKFSQTSGEIVGWILSANSFYRGAEKNSAGLFTNNSGDITIGSQGIRGYKWRLDSSGAGSLAGGNISWKVDGTVTFDASVSLNWSNISGAIGNKLTKIDADGIYTGTLTASQVNALTCTFDKGTIGGWTINANSITKNNVSLGSDGTIGNGSYWKLNSDGSGFLAGGNISWKASNDINIVGKITATSGFIGDWKIENKDIVSIDDNVIFHSNNGYSYLQLKSERMFGGIDMLPEYGSHGSIIKLSAMDGVIQTTLYSSVSYSTGTSYLSPTGIFANLAGTQALSVTTGCTHRAAIVGLGFGNLNKSEWSVGVDDTIVAGIYGRASNSGTAPDFGGYFQDLKACGLVLNRKFISDSTSDGYKISSYDSLIIGITNSGVRKTVYLPNDGKEGRVIIFKQMGQGGLKIDTLSGQDMYDDDTVNDYFDLDTGWMAICCFQIYYINKERKEVWSFNKFRW